MNKKWSDLYQAASRLMTHIGAVGEINARDEHVYAVMNALYAIDGGVFDGEAARKKCCPDDSAQDLGKELAEAKALADHWRDCALGHIACEQHTQTHVGEMVDCPFCVADSLRAELAQAEETEAQLREANQRLQNQIDALQGIKDRKDLAEKMVREEREWRLKAQAELAAEKQRYNAAFVDAETYDSQAGEIDRLRDELAKVKAVLKLF